MSLAERLRDYRVGRFTDEDVVRCTGLSARGWRELIKFGVVRTITENDRGRGHVRLCDAIVFKRAAVIAALSEAGFSLAVAGRIAYFVPFHWSLFEICDPGNVSVRGATVSDTHRVLPLRLRKANANWFNPARPASVDPKIRLARSNSRSTFRKRRVSASGETGRLWRLARRRYEVCRVGPTLCKVSIRAKRRCAAGNGMGASRRSVSRRCLGMGRADQVD